jgi:hypothetical protein
MMLGFASYFGNAGAPDMWRLAGSVAVAASTAGSYAFFPFERLGFVRAKSRSRADTALLVYLLFVALFAYAAPRSATAGDSWEPYVAMFALPLGGVVLAMILGALGVGRLILRKAGASRCTRCSRVYLARVGFCVVDGARFDEGDDAGPER